MQNLQAGTLTVLAHAWLLRIISQWVQWDDTRLFDSGQSALHKEGLDQGCQTRVFTAASHDVL